MRLLADAGHSLLAIINDILDLSKVEAGKIALEAIALSPGGLVHGALALIRSEALRKDLELEATIAPDVPVWVNGDPTRLRQILLNLMTNALKFTERGRNIPVVALSANVMPEEIVRCREAGMNDHLAKPIDRAAMRQVIGTWATRDDESRITSSPDATA